VNNTHTDPIKSGSLNHVQEIGADVIRGSVEDNKWFITDILALGQSVTVKLNDKQVADWTEPEGWTGTRDTS
jgi:hypothetical protein